MSNKLLPIFALIAFASVPVVIGGAEQAKQETEQKADAKPQAEAAAVESAPRRKLSTECLASEEVIQDLETREKKLKEKELSLKEKEKEIEAQASAVKDELVKLEDKRKEIQGIHEKELASREEQVNKLIETFEGMSPKSAAQVINGVDEELAVMALGKLSSVKAGKILANLKAEKSAKLSELMAFGKPGKENVHEQDRTPANSKH